MEQKQTLVHGGDWAGYMLEHGALPLDFSANVSPLGMPEGVKQAICAAAQTADRYPDPLCRALCTALARSENMPEAFLLCGNGAADLIFRIVLARHPHKALVTAPTFAEYEAALKAAGCTVQRYSLREEREFRLEESFLNAIQPGLDMTFLCEPNNPTGITSPQVFLRRVAERCRACGTLLVLDECFADFLEEPSAHTMKPFLAEYPNVLILKAFTKLYGMAGVRLGYCLCADAGLLAAMRAAGQPWAVSSLAQAAGLAALQETDYVAEVQQLIAAQRPLLVKGLQAMGLTVLPGEANYLLLKSEKALAESLRQKGILVRSCANYPGLGESWLRIAVRTQKENERLLSEMRGILA